jgi:hypothetical protein
MISFPKLGERTVKVKGADGKIFDVRKISINDHATIERIIDDTANTCKPLPLEEQAKPMIAAKAAIAAVVSPYLPEELKGDLWRFGYYELVEFSMYLAFGSENPDDVKPANPKKKAKT